MLNVSEPDRLADDRVTLEAARSAVTQATVQLTGLLRLLPDRTAPAVDEWTAGDVAAHLAHVAVARDIAPRLCGVHA